MPLLKLIAEGVGPFERLDLDLSDGNGKPHLGPHILAGVNGSGKSTVLRTIAWVLSRGGNSFPLEEWKHSLTGYEDSRALLRLGSGALASASSDVGLAVWVNQHTRLMPQSWGNASGNTTTAVGKLEKFLAAAYAPGRMLRHIARPSLTKDPSDTAFSFDSAVDNEAIQSWILGLHCQAAIAETRKEPVELFTAAIGRFTDALKLIYGSQVKLQVDYLPVLRPRLIVAGKNLNFSQLPQGINNTVGWLADFMMRQSRAGTNNGVLLIDEIDAHLHPAWQRIILPAIRKALPDVQIIVTTHSPFVISSCPEARVHLLAVDNEGRARLDRSIDAPFGESIFATMKDIFGVKSRFDPQTEREFNEWVELRDEAEAHPLSPSKKTKMVKLTKTLASRSEELRALVSSDARIPAKRANGRKAKRKTS